LCGRAFLRGVGLSLAIRALTEDGPYLIDFEVKAEESVYLD